MLLMLTKYQLETKSVAECMLPFQSNEGLNSSLEKAYLIEYFFSNIFMIGDKYKTILGLLIFM